jgi:hypothetical protein
MEPLKEHYDRLCRRLDAYELHFAKILKERTSIPRRRLYFLQEGLLSQTWQAWNAFCRTLAISSATGTITRQGAVLNPCVVPPTSERVSYVARCVRERKSPVAGDINSILRYEITWGDVIAFGRLVAELQPQNQTTLQAAFGGVSGGPIHMQKVRNCAAHINAETLNELRAIRVSYSSTLMGHPTDAMRWIDQTSKKYAYIAWLDDLKLIADVATR